MRQPKVAGERGSVLLRTLDRAIGIPLVAALSLFRRKRSAPPAMVRTIALLETAAIGDTTLLSAVLRDLRKHYPHSHITLFVGSTNASVARLLEGPDEVVLLPIKNVARAAGIVRASTFDLFLDYGPWPRLNALISFLAKARYKVGFNSPGQFRHYLYDLAVTHSPRQHELENFRDLLRAVGVSVGSAPGFPDAVGAGELPEQYRVAGDYVVFHLWPGGYRAHLKEWPLSRWLQLGDEFARMGFKIVLTGAPSEKQRNDEVVTAAREKQSAAQWKNCAGASLDQTIGILRRSRMTVSVNTGVMHLAAVLGVPVIGLHGPTAVDRWGPVGPHTAAIRAQGDDCGYLNLGFEYPAHCECMSRIGVPEVLTASLNLLGRPGMVAAEALNQSNG